MPRSLRWPAGLAAALSLLTLALIFALPTGATPAATASYSDVLVQFDHGVVATRRITFTGVISGLEALRRTGLPLVESGGAVCRIGDTGCGAEQECFCACPPPYDPCLFWEYAQLHGGAWATASTGAADTTVANGGAEGWAWGRPLPRVTLGSLSARAGLQWLRARQQADGSYPGFGGNVGATLDTILAARAAGENPATWRSAAGASLLDALAAGAPAYAARGASSAGKLALGLAAADLDPRSALGMDLAISITATYDAASGAYGATNWDQSLAILGLRAAGEPIPAAAVSLLAARANPDGGFPFTPGGASDVDSTSLALQALAAAGAAPAHPAVAGAMAFLDAAQNSDGGFPNTPDAGGADTSNVNSTAFAVQGILAAGGDPLAASWRPAATSPISYLLSLQQPDGAFTYEGQPSQIATQQAVPALLGRPFPYPSAAVASRRALGFIRAQQGADGSFQGFGLGSTLDAILAISAAGADPQSFASGSGARPLDSVAPRAAPYAAGSAAATGKLMTAVVAAGADPRDFAGLNLVISATLRYDPATGAFGSSTWDQAWAMIGLAAAGETVPLSATERLEAIQATGGGWGFEPDAAAADADSTGLALQALAVAKRRVAGATCASGDSAAERAGLAFLRAAQNPDGGFPGFDGSTSASTTGLALQALAASGEPARSLAWTTTITDGTASALTERSPSDALLGLQSEAGGFPGFGGPDDPAATYQALPGVVGRAFPVRARSLIYLAAVSR